MVPLCHQASQTESPENISKKASLLCCPLGARPDPPQTRNYLPKLQLS